MYLDCIINSNKDSIPPPFGFCGPPLVSVTYGGQFLLHLVSVDLPWSLLPVLPVEDLF